MTDSLPVLLTVGLFGGDVATIDMSGLLAIPLEDWPCKWEYLESLALLVETGPFRVTENASHFQRLASAVFGYRSELDRLLGVGGDTNGFPMVAVHNFLPGLVSWLGQTFATDGVFQWTEKDDGCLNAQQVAFLYGVAGSIAGCYLWKLKDNLSQSDLGLPSHHVRALVLKLSEGGREDEPME